VQAVGGGQVPGGDSGGRHAVVVLPDRADARMPTHDARNKITVLDIDLVQRIAAVAVQQAI
jgi:hypothetical protein